MTGQHKLHPKVMIVCAGNLATDRAIVNNLSTAMQSRVIHLEMEVNNNEWLEDVAIKYNYDSRIIAFLSYMPQKLMDFRPDHNDKTFSCPRTWEFMNDLIKGHEVTHEDAGLYAGTITSGVAIEFINFTKVFATMPKYSDIIKNPTTHMLPPDNASKWATIVHILEHLKEEHFSDILKYINRLSAEFRTLFFRILIIRKPELRTHPDFGKAALELAKYLYD